MTQDEEIATGFFRNRISRAILARTLPGTRQNFSACRLIHAESDGLPGITVDKYGDYLVCQFLSAGAEHWKTDIVRILEEQFSTTQLRGVLENGPCKGIYERSDVAVREKEGLFPSTGVLSGDCPPERIQIQEGDLRFRVDVLKGHKTGFYLDQRENRAMIPEFCKGAEVLNCFAYTGAFGVAALAAGAETVTNIESSAALLEQARENVALNGLDSARVQNLPEDVFHTLRRFRDSRRSFDVIILDPPKFAESQSQIPKACRGYKDINLLAAKAPETRRNADHVFLLGTDAAGSVSKNCRGRGKGCRPKRADRPQALSGIRSPHGPGVSGRNVSQRPDLQSLVRKFR